MSEEQTVLPPGWACASLEDTLEIVRGVTFPASAKRPEPGPDTVLCLRTSNVQASLKWDDVLNIPSSYVRSNSRWLKHNDIVISMANSLELVGKVALADSPPEKTTFGGFLSVIRSHGLDPRFVFFLFRSPAFVHEMRQTASRTVNIANLSLRGMNPLQVRFAPLNEQKRIVAKIEALQERSDAAKEALDAIPPLLEKFRQSVLAAAFRGDLTKAWRAENPDVESASELLARIRIERRTRWIENAAVKARDRARARAAKAGKPWSDEHDAKVLERERAKAAKKYKAPEPVEPEGLPELPEGWCWASVDTVAFVTKLAGFEYTKFVNYDPTGDLAVLKAENAGKNGFVTTDFSFVHADTVAHLTRSAVQAGDVLMVFVGAGVGQVATVPNDREYFLGPNISMIRPTTQQIVSRYMEFFLRSPVGKRLTLSFSKATAQGSLSMGSIRKIPLAIPPVHEQQHILASLEPLLEGADESLETQATLAGTLASLNQSILAKAFRGELVPQDPDDEPATALLARIRAEREAAEATKGKKKRGRGRGRRKKPAPAVVDQPPLPGMDGKA